MKSHAEHRVLAIQPNTRGFGYVVFEGPGPSRLIDWGCAHVPGANNQSCLARLASLLCRYAPDVLVIENHVGQDSRRRTRVRQLVFGILKLAAVAKLTVRTFSRSRVRETFSDARAVTKDQIAAVLAGRYSELASRLPPIRRTWMSEDPRMAIFDAAALALTYFDARERRRRAHQARSSDPHATT